MESLELISGRQILVGSSEGRVSVADAVWFRKTGVLTAPSK